jgi:hypothetical protein
MSAHQPSQRRAQLVVEREFRPDPARCIAAIVRLLTYQSSAHRAAVTDTADDRRPLGVGDQLQTQDDRAARPRNLDAVAVEDGRHEPTDV